MSARAQELYRSLWRGRGQNAHIVLLSKDGIRAEGPTAERGSLAWKRRAFKHHGFPQHRVLHIPLRALSVDHSWAC